MAVPPSAHSSRCFLPMTVAAHPRGTLSARCCALYSFHRHTHVTDEDTEAQEGDGTYPETEQEVAETQVECTLHRWGSGVHR